MVRFSHCIAVVTGAGSGIGEATARRLAKEGAKVVLVGRTEAKLQRAAEEINQEYPDSADFFAADVTVEQDVAALADYVKERYGNLHVLINNAGGSYQSRFKART